MRSEYCTTEYLLSQLTNRAEAVNDSRNGGDGFTGALERLMLAQLSAHCRGYQGEGTDDQTS